MFARRIAEEEGESEDDEEISSSSPKSQFGGTSRLDPRAVLSIDIRAIFLIYIINFLDSLGGSISTPILPFYAREFDASYAQVGQLFSAFALTQMLSMPVLSWASDKYGRRAVLLVATIGSGVGSFWQGTALSYESLLLSRIFQGFWSGVASVCQVYLVDVVPPDLRADYISYLNSSTQASVLFGPSIGAGLSALGLRAPLFVQAGVNLVMCLVVWAHLPESPEWNRLHSPMSPGSMSPSSQPIRQVGMGRKLALIIIMGFGILSFCGMVAQMAIMSMFAVYSERTYDMDSVQVGFTMTLGAISSVGTNIWISPLVLRRLGESGASLLGFAMIFVGSCIIALQPFWLTVVGFMLAYQGLAINSSAVATGAANLTDSTSRATIMTGARMLKSLGAVVGPILSGHLASQDVHLPFLAAASFGLAGFVAQVCSLPLMGYIKELMAQRKTVGRKTPFLDGRWVDERGTQEEIWDLGNYVANLLTSRHYRWVTYNPELKSFLSDCFPPVSTESEEAHRVAYDSRRKIVRRGMDVSYEELWNLYEELSNENRDLKVELRRKEQPAVGGGRGRSQSRETRRENRQQENMGKAMSYQQLMPGVSGFGGSL